MHTVNEKKSKNGTDLCEVVHGCKASTYKEVSITLIALVLHKCMYLHAATHDGICYLLISIHANKLTVIYYSHRITGDFQLDSLFDYSSSLLGVRSYLIQSLKIASFLYQPYAIKKSMHSFISNRAKCQLIFRASS